MTYKMAMTEQDGILRVDISGERVAGRTRENARLAWSRAAEECRARNISLMLVVSRLTGRYPAADAFEVSSRLEDTGMGRHIKIAFVDLNEESLPDLKFAEMVGVNRGWTGRIFDNERDAIEWLRQFSRKEKSGAPQRGAQPVDSPGALPPGPGEQVVRPPGVVAGDTATLDSPGATSSIVGRWVLLFPATYLAHIAEEFRGGFPAYASGITGLAVTEAVFLAANALFLVVMTVAVLAVLGRPSRAPLVVALATIVTINAALHVGGALLTASYSPGVVSAVLLWLPLGASTLARGHRALSKPGFRCGVLMGVAAHLLIPLVGAGFVMLLGGGGGAS